MNILRRAHYITVAAILCGCVRASAQLSLVRTVGGGLLSDEAQTFQILPDAPSSALATRDRESKQPVDHDNAIDREKLAPRYAATIEPAYQAKTLNAGAKTIFTANELFSLHFAAGAILAAAYSQGVESDPKYGTNSEAFAKRIGAAGARGASQIIFSDALLSPVFHEDPRYYVLGSTHRALPRALYAASRVLIVRKDNGHQTINLSQLLGYGSSAALTQLYYPVGSRSYKTTLSGYGESLGGLAIQNELDEFVRFLVRHQPR